MKKLILLLVVLITTLRVNCQTNYTVIDTTFTPDQKWQLVQNSIDRLTNQLGRIYTDEQIRNINETGVDTVYYANETIALINYFYNGLNQYKFLWNKLDTISYTKYPCKPFQISNGQSISEDFYLNNDTTHMGLIRDWDIKSRRMLVIMGTVEDYSESNEYKSLNIERVRLEKLYNKLLIQK